MHDRTCLNQDLLVLKAHRGGDFPLEVLHSPDFLISEAERL